MSDDSQQEFTQAVERETRLRLDRITSTPGEILRWDTDGDGVISPDEWEVLRSVVEAEVVRELSGEAPNLPEDTLEDIAAYEPVVEVIDDRYEVVREIGRGSQAKLFLARNKGGGGYVALKELIFANVDSWKSVELFEREASALSILDHPAIPKFVDTFKVDMPNGSQRFFLAQEFVSGESLRVLLARGERFKEGDIVRLGREIFDVLTYLHELNPPVIHRDIKPSNIIRRKNGQFVLVDFGGVQLIDKGSTGGSTVVGTTGYMPPEQIIGRATPQSDIYAVGATLVHLLTHIPPSELPQERLRLVWRDRVMVDDALASIIDQCLQPVAEDRPKSAREARSKMRVSTVTTLPAKITSGGELTKRERVVELSRSRPGSTRLLWGVDKLTIDLSARLKVTEWIALGSVILTGVLLFSVSMYPLAFFMFAGAATFGIMTLTQSSETLEIDDAGEFRWLVDGQDNARGRLRAVTSAAEGMVLFSERDETIRVGKACSASDQTTIVAVLRELIDNPHEPEETRGLLD